MSIFSQKNARVAFGDTLRQKKCHKNKKKAIPTTEISKKQVQKTSKFPTKQAQKQPTRKSSKKPATPQKTSPNSRKNRKVGNTGHGPVAWAETQPTATTMEHWWFDVN